MALKFIDSPDERVVRSVGDPPHGVVGWTWLGDDEHVGVAVTGTVDTDELRKRGAWGVLVDSEHDPHVHYPVSVADAVEAFDCLEAAAAFVELAVPGTLAMVHACIDKGAPELGSRACDVLGELFAALRARAKRDDWQPPS